MASKVLELLVSMVVEGTKDAAKATELVNELKKAVKDLGDQKLNKLLDFDTSKLDIDLEAVEEGMREVTTAAKILRREWAATMETLKEKAAGDAQRRFEALRQELDKLKSSAAESREQLKRQFEVLKEASFGAKAAETAKLTAEMERLKEGSEKFARSFKQVRELFAIGKLKFDLDIGEADVKLRKVKGQVKETIDLFLQAGKTPVHINTAELQAEAEKARAAANRLGNEIIRLHQAANGVRVGAAGAAAGIGAVGREARGSASPLGRMREEAESLGREFLFLRRLAFGLGFGFLAREILDTVKSFDALRQSLVAVFGEAQAAKEMEFIRVEAERLGIQIATLGKEYAKLTVATKAAGFSQQETRDLFLSIAEAGAKLSLSQQEIAGALTAVQQIASKGRLSLEELRQQLGDRLPGAIQIAAKALGVTERRLFAMVEQGQVASDVFLRVFPAAIRASFGTDASTRIDTTSAAIQRFNNAIAEFTDTVTRSGALDAFTSGLKELTRLSKDPSVIEFFKGLSKTIGSIITILKDHATAVKDLVFAYLGFKALSFVLTALAGLGGGFRGAAAAATSFTVANTAAGVTITANTAKAGLLATALGGLGRAFAAVAIGTAVIDVLESTLNKALDAGLKFAEANRQIASSLKLEKIFEDQKRQLADWNSTVIIGIDSLRRFSAVNLQFYKTASEGAKAYFTAHAASLGEAIKREKAHLDVLILSGDKSEAAAVAAANYRKRISELSAEQKEATAKAEMFAGQLKTITVVAKENGVTLREETKTLAELSLGLEDVATTGKNLNTLTFDELNNETKALVTGFDNVIASGKGVRDALKQAFPADIAEGSKVSIVQAARALEVVQAQGKATGKVISEELAHRLDRLTANELLNFEFRAKQAFEENTIRAKGLGLMIDGVVKAAIKNLGVDTDATGKHISKAFHEMTSNLLVLSLGVDKTSKVLQAAFEKAVDTAKTRDELELLRATFVTLGLTGSQTSAGIRNAFQVLEDKLLALRGTVTGALGESFKFFAISTADNLAALAELAIRHFNRITESGLAGARELREAWIKMFDATALGKAFADLGIKSQQTLQVMVDQARASFGEIARSGNVTADAILKAYEAVRERAVAAGEGTKNLGRDAEAAGEALRIAFEKGNISAAQYADGLIALGNKTREAAVAPVGALQAAFATFGAKSRSELILLYQQAVEAFNIISRSGNVTSDVLQDAAAEVEKRWVAAFGRIQDAAETAFTNIQSFETQGFRRDFPAFDAAGLKRASTDELKDLMKGLEDQLAFQTRPGATPDPLFLKTLLAALQQLINELNRRGERTGAASANVPVDPRTGNFNINFNFGGAPDERWVRSFLIPTLDRYRARQG